MANSGDRMVWLDRTEVVAGLVFTDRVDGNIVNSADFYPPYDEAIATFQKTKSIEKVIAAHGISVHRAAIEAASAVTEEDERGTVCWVDLLQQAASFYKYGQELAKMSDSLIMGKTIDPGKLLQFVSELNLGHRTLTPLDQVEPEKAQWILTGYSPIDEYVGGIPKAGLVALAGGTGIGKTTLALKIAVSLIRNYPGKKKPLPKGTRPSKKKPVEWIEEPGKVAIFSLEMLLSQVVARLIDLDESITKEERSRILASESAYTVGEIYAVAARTAAQENLKAIIIDFADMLIEGEQSEAAMGMIYRSLAMLAKTTGVPVILVCQFSRKEDATGIPKITWIRYSAMAEMMAALVLLLYNPSVTVTDVKANAVLPFYPDMGYIIIGKSRFGFKMGKPGAIQVAFTGESGWGEIGHRYFNVYA